MKRSELSKLIRELLQNALQSRLHNIQEYSPEEKQRLGIPVDAVSRGGKWYSGDTYIGRVSGGRFVSADQEASQERDRAEFEFPHSYEPPEQEEPASSQTLPVKSEPQSVASTDEKPDTDPFVQHKDQWAELLQMDFNKFEDELDARLGADETRKDMLRHRRTIDRAMMGIPHENEMKATKVFNNLFNDLYSQPERPKPTKQNAEDLADLTKERKRRMKEREQDRESQKFIKVFR